MARRAILYIDLLGVQKMWADGGWARVRDRIDEFNQFITSQVTYLPPELHRQGDYTVVLSGDSVSIICEDFDQAIGVGIHLFTQAFYDTNKRDLPFWFRGAISRWHNQYLTFNSRPIVVPAGLHVGTQYRNEDDYLTVLALEKSGYKGMRLLVNRGFLVDKGLQYQRDWPGQGNGNSLGIVTRLYECSYPEGDYADVLWMADSDHHFPNLSKIISSRFKKATRDPDEFAQAAWTRVVFDQVNSLIWDVKNRPRATAAAAVSEMGPTGNQVTDHSPASITSSEPAGTPLISTEANGDPSNATGLHRDSIEASEDSQGDPGVGGPTT